MALVRSCPAAGTATTAEEEAAADNIVNKARRIEHAPARYPLVTANRTSSIRVSRYQAEYDVTTEISYATQGRITIQRCGGGSWQGNRSCDTHKQQGGSIANRTAYNAQDLSKSGSIALRIREVRVAQSGSTNSPTVSGWIPGAISRPFAPNTDHDASNDSPRQCRWRCAPTTAPVAAPTAAPRRPPTAPPMIAPPAARVLRSSEP